MNSELVTKSNLSGFFAYAEDFAREFVSVMRSTGKKGKAQKACKKLAVKHPFAKKHFRAYPPAGEQFAKAMFVFQTAKKGYRSAMDNWLFDHLKYNVPQKHVLNTLDKIWFETRGTE